MRKEEILNFILKHKIIAILRHIPEEDILFLIQALIEGGIRIFEITFTNKNPLDMIKKLKSKFKEEVLIGAGTITTEQQFISSVRAGADFFVSPYFKKTFSSIAKKHKKLYIPGCLSPTEIINAKNSGCNLIKIFPISSLGPKYIKDLKAPFSEIYFMPSGGITLKNVKLFLKSGADCFGIGSELISPKLVARRKFNIIKNKALEFTKTICSGDTNG